MPHNYFTPLRLFLALCVALEHIFYFQNGEASALFELGHTSPGYFAVNGFFIISGYLITGSAERSGDVAIFFKSRILRIMPALIMLGLILGLVVTPLLGSQSPLSVLTDKSTWRAILELVTFVRPFPEWPNLLMATNPFPGNLTGPVWTLRYEVLAYLGTGLLLMLGLHRNRALLVLMAGVATFLLALDLQTELITEASATLGALLRFGSCYLYGVGAYLFADRLKFGPKTISSGLILGSAFILLGFPAGEIAINLALTPLIFAIAFMKVSAPRWVTNPPDYSYGIYIAHWPVYQILVETADGQPIGWHLLMLGVPLTLLVAALSWHLLEKPCLRLKRRAHRPAASGVKRPALGV